MIKPGVLIIQSQPLHWEPSDLHQESSRLFEHTTITPPLACSSSPSLVFQSAHTPEKATTCPPLNQCDAIIHCKKNRLDPSRAQTISPSSTRFPAYATTEHSRHMRSVDGHLAVRTEPKLISLGKLFLKACRMKSCRTPVCRQSTQDHNQNLRIGSGWMYVYPSQHIRSPPLLHNLHWSLLYRFVFFSFVWCYNPTPSLIKLVGSCTH